MNRGPIGRLLGAVAGVRLRQLGIATLMLALLGGIGIAHAGPKSIGEFGLAGNGRAWDFQGGTFGIADGQIAVGRAGDDAFDGGAMLAVDGIFFTDLDSHGTFNRKQNSFSVGPETTAGLRVARTEHATGPYIRSLVTLRNAQASPYQGTIGWYSGLGSDGAEDTQASSSGDNSFTKADRWVVSSETGANGWGDDPTLGFAFYGKRANERIDANNGPGSGAVDVDFEDLRVPANATRYLLLYTEMHPNPKQAKKSMAKYDSQGLSPALLKGIPSKVRNKVVNWNL